MSKHPFGWSLPSGVSQRMIDEQAGNDETCEVCGKWCGECSCPECPECHFVGSFNCYLDHGLEPLPEHQELIERIKRQEANDQRVFDELAASERQWEEWEEEQERNWPREDKE